ncbi:MAG: gamma-glutamyl-gamma-aminobutyrate hydrolase family protein [Acidobacteriota bacterium]
MHPTIAVTTCRSLPDYIESVRRAGGEPRCLNPAIDVPSDVIGWCAGVIFTGGDDVSPERYGEEPHPSIKCVDPTRDAFEIELARLAMQADVPILGICRGLQVLNVAGGGSLIQDIPSQVTGAAEHTVPTPLFGVAHEVWVTRGTRLAALMESVMERGDTLEVNSRHHQSVARLADGFEVSATSPDGVVEAIERRESRFCVAVQWHPENFWRTGEFRPLFEGFVEACRLTRA